jgi:formylglycine-generating enzyme required for sulfatase activity
LKGLPSERAQPIGGSDDAFLGRYLVTVQEFARFVRAGAYERPDWNPEFRQMRDAQKWSEPLSWNRQKLAPNAPVAGVSWHEAAEYCRWLTIELRKQGQHFIARLPTATEWSMALSETASVREASAEHGPHLPNASSPLIPVGLQPECRSPTGHEDIGSLVWEWLGPRNQKSQRHCRQQICALPGVERIAVLRNVRGARRVRYAGFRVLFERTNTPTK